MADILMTAKDFCTRATTLYLNRENWTYCQGGLGELGESARIKGLYEYYYSQPNKSKYMTYPYKEWLSKFGKGHQCTDCSNFINVLLGYDDNYYSVWRLGTLPEFKGNIEEAPAGTVLWMEGHVGVSLGNGKWMDMPHYNTTYRLGDWSEPKPLWKKAVFLPEVDYEHPVKLEVKVTDKERHVGDVISYDDFIVTNVYKDGTARINRAYNYTPGIITYDKCQVAIVYDGLTTYATLTAERTGDFYAVMVKATSANTALEIQKALIADGYTDTAVVKI